MTTPIPRAHFDDAETNGSRRIRNPVSRLVAALVLAVVLSGATALIVSPDAHAAGGVSESTPPSVPFYVVQTSSQGQQEFLFEIAERFLGSGNRFMEIFDLNKGRIQPDGGKLTDPTSLNPGWILQLPADASGSGLQTGPLPGAAQPSASPSQHTSAPTSSPRPPAPQASTAPAAGASPAIWIGIGLAVLLAIAAGIVFILRGRNAKARPDTGVAVTDRSASWTIDGALKILVAACEAEHLPFPGLYLVTVDATSIHVLLSSPSANSPTGWTASSDGRSWSASLARLQVQQVPDRSNDQFAGLATLGIAKSGRLLLDFDHARGLISVEGDTGAVTDVVNGWLLELRDNPWSGTPEILRLGSRGAGQQESIEAFLARPDRADNGIAVFDDPPSKSQLQALTALFSAPDFAWIFIVKGALANAAWRFAVRDGLVTSGFLPDVQYSVPSVDPATAGSGPARPTRK